MTAWSTYPMQVRNDLMTTDRLRRGVMRLFMPSVSFSKATAAIVRARICRWPMPQGGAINVLAGATDANQSPGQQHRRPCFAALAPRATFASF